MLLREVRLKIRPDARNAFSVQNFSVRLIRLLFRIQLHDSFSTGGLDCFSRIGVDTNVSSISDVHKSIMSIHNARSLARLNWFDFLPTTKQTHAIEIRLVL